MRKVSHVDRVAQLLGIARRAGAIALGSEAVREALRSGEAELVLIAVDASPKQVAKVRRTIAGHPTRWAPLGNRATLGAAVGVDTVTAVAVTDRALADRVAEELPEGACRQIEEVEAVAAAEE